MNTYVSNKQTDRGYDDSVVHLKRKRLGSHLRGLIAQRNTTVKKLSDRFHDQWDVRPTTAEKYILTFQKGMTVLTPFRCHRYQRAPIYAEKDRTRLRDLFSYLHSMPKREIEHDTYFAQRSEVATVLQERMKEKKVTGQALAKEFHTRWGISELTALRHISFLRNGRRVHSIPRDEFQNKPYSKQDARFLRDMFTYLHRLE